MSKTVSVPKGAILDAWSEAEWDNGVQLEEMKEFDSLAVQTQNSLYQITVLSGRTGDILVRGGKYFPEQTPARLSGSTLGGSFLKVRGIYVGMKMEIVPQPTEMVSQVEIDPVTGQEEFLLGYKAIITSPVQSIGIVI